MSITPTGKGYWLVGGDGGIFNFGDAGFFGSTGDLKLNAPIIDLGPSVDNRATTCSAPTAACSPSAPPTSRARPAT